jgi:hypothetical protein
MNADILSLRANKRNNSESKPCHFRWRWLLPLLLVWACGLWGLLPTDQHFVGQPNGDIIGGDLVDTKRIVDGLERTEHFQNTVAWAVGGLDRERLGELVISAFMAFGWALWFAIALHACAQRCIMKLRSQFRTLHPHEAFRVFS